MKGSVLPIPGLSDTCPIEIRRSGGKAVLRVCKDGRSRGLSPYLWGYGNRGSDDKGSSVRKSHKLPVFYKTPEDGYG